ncbi:hypothetical protein Leryth_015136, partial [Lithospermum erythrorhizon]
MRCKMSYIGTVPPYELKFCIHILSPLKEHLKTRTSTSTELFPCKHHAFSHSHRLPNKSTSDNIKFSEPCSFEFPKKAIWRRTTPLCPLLRLSPPSAFTLETIRRTCSSTVPGSPRPTGSILQLAIELEVPIFVARLAV